MFTYRPEKSMRNKWIIESLESLRAQKHVNIQAVILDDGSPLPIPDKLLEDNDNIKFTYIHYDENRGKHKMMDIGLPMMKAPVMTTLHDDDRLYSNIALQIRHQFFYSVPKTSLIWTESLYKRGNTIFKRSKIISQPKVHSHNLLLQKNYICGATYLVDTKLKQRFRADTSLNHAEEYDIWLQISKYSELNNLKLRYNPRATAMYRLHKEQSYQGMRDIGKKERYGLLKSIRRNRK